MLAMTIYAVKINKCTIPTPPLLRKCVRKIEKNTTNF